MKYLRLILIFIVLHMAPLAAHSCASSDTYFQSAYYIEFYDFDKLFDVYYAKSAEDPYTKREEEYKAYCDGIRRLEESKNLAPLDFESVPSYGSGSLPSNNYSTALTFLEAAFADPNVKGQWQDLIQLRQDMLGMFRYDYDTEELLNRIRKLDPNKVAGYGAYLEAAFYLYKGEYDKAREIYAQLKTSKSEGTWFKRLWSYFIKSPYWLEETAAYMEARTLLLMAQENEGYTWPFQPIAVDKKTLQKSYDLFQAYLNDYPDGRYVNSVQNLQRKFYRLLGEREKLNHAIKDNFNTASKLLENSEEVHRFKGEFEMYFTGEIEPESDSPILIAYELQKRNPSEQDLSKALTALEQRKHEFEAYPGLFAFLKVLALYNLKRFKDAVKVEVSPELIKKGNIVSIGTEILQINSYRELGQFDKALQLLKSLKDIKEDDQIDLLLLRTHIALKSPKLEILKDLSSQRIRAVFVNVLLSAEDLEDLSSNAENLAQPLQEELKRALLNTYVTTGEFQKALSLGNLPCAEKPVFQAFVKNPSNSEDSLELGKLLMESYSPWSAPDWWIGDLRYACPECVPIDFNYKPPIHYFMRVVEDHKKTKQESEVEAEALHFLCGTCFHSGYRHARCTWDDFYLSKELEAIHKEMVPRWFARLHKVYKRSKWARNTPYYY